MATYACGNRCGVPMRYIGGGNWECPKCGKIIPFGEPDDDEDEDSESYCNICEHSNEYPDCILRCPYDDN